MLAVSLKLRVPYGLSQLEAPLASPSGIHLHQLLIEFLLLLPEFPQYLEIIGHLVSSRQLLLLLPLSL
jgi:hypothetical protein